MGEEDRDPKIERCRPYALPLLPALENFAEDRRAFRDAAGQFVAVNEMREFGEETKSRLSGILEKSPTLTCSIHKLTCCFMASSRRPFFPLFSALSRRETGARYSDPRSCRPSSWIAPLLDRLAWSGERVRRHKDETIKAGSRLTLPHHALSSPRLCNSRWCSRQSGTVNSSLTFRPKALGCMKRR
jgi:hypothetical protein